MEENSELEEGEAHCYKGDKDNIDPDTDLSYIDDKVQNILGHHRKYFEGGVSKDILGAKFGGYGSFLPTHERCSNAKTSQSYSNTPISQCNLSMEGTSQNFQPVSNVSSFTRLGTVSCSDHSLQNSGVPSGDVPMKHDLHLSSARVADKFNIKDESSSRSGNLTDQRTLKVRIKVSSNKMPCKNMAIYSGLGLENSPSSSLGNSTEESGGKNPVSRESADESPTSILQVMTSFPVPGGVLVSPLHDSLFYLIKKETLSRDNEYVSSLKGSQEHSAMSVDKSVARMGNQKLLKEKKVNLLGKNARPVERSHGTDVKDENDSAFLKKKLEKQTPGGKEINHNNASHISLSNSEYVFGSVKGMGRASEVSRGVDKDEVSDRLFSSNIMREDSLDSISGQDSGKSQKNGKCRLVKKVSEQVGINSHHDVLGYLGDSGRYKGQKTHGLLKSRSGASKCNDDPLVPSKQKVGKKPSSQVQDEIKLNDRMKPLFEDKKSKGNHSRGQIGVVSIKESLRDGVALAPKGLATTSHGASTCKNKMQKLKSQKYSYKARFIQKDSLDINLEQTNNQLESPSSIKPSKNIDCQVMHGPSIKDDPFMVPSAIEGRNGTEMVPAVGDPVVIKENWVCCDNCQTWRLLPFGTLPEHLPENWLCRMLNWLPGMNRCDISEEETTKALYALYQHNVLNDANGPASVITLDHGQHLDQKHQSSDSAAVSILSKKRYASKGLPKAGDNYGIQISNTTNNHQQDSVKIRSLNDKDHPPAESNVTKRSSSLHFIKSCNLDFDKRKTKPKEEQTNGGDSKKLKMIKKRAADQQRRGSSKKAKIEDTYATNRYRNSVVDCGKVGLKPNTGLQTEEGGKNTLTELSCSLDAKHDTKDRVLLCRKKLGDQARVSLDGGSLDVRMLDKRNNSQTKRKWQCSQNGQDSKEYAKEESSESGLGKEKKYGLHKTENRGVSSNKGADDKFNNRVASFFSSKGCVVDGMVDVGSVDKGQKNWKNRRDFVSQQTSNAVESVRRDFGSGEVSMAATSSSSKVSGSCKNRAGFEEVKSSPVESVSSSPFRTSFAYPDKLTSAAEDILGNDDAGTDSALVNKIFERFLDGEGNAEINRSGTARKEKDSSSFRPQSLKFSCKASVSKASKYPLNVGNKNEFSLSLGHHSPDVHGNKDLNAQIPRNMKSFSLNATIVLKEAKELRDYADRLKSSGFDFETNEAYFQSALKFFQGASLLETCNGESGRNGEMTPVQAYRTTAKLCEFCGHGYERRQEMAAASLAYKCMEVAYMRVVYCKQSSTSRDRIELQAALHMTSQGESPSSSASDVDNLNNQMTAVKATLSKGTVPHVTGNHAIVAGNRPNFIRLLDLTQDVDFAMEASRKSQNAFADAVAAAGTVTLEEGRNRDYVTLIKSVIDFSFQDVEGFLRLVRLAMDTINRSG